MCGARSLLLTLLLLLGATGTSGADSRADPYTAPEHLLFQQIPIVITSTRTERSLLDVPDAATVITAEDIRASGAITLSELLVWVPGLEFMRNSASDLNLASRGFNTTSSSQLLVMIDGRTTYADFFGIVLWDQLNVNLEDIERIEVIRGPGSALYGANAFSGTVNIITKRARDLPRLQARVGVGTQGSMGSATAAYSNDRAAFKGSVRYEVRDHFRNETNPSNADHRRDETGLRLRLFNGTVEYDLSDDTQLTLNGGFTVGHGDIMTQVGTFNYDGPTYFARLNLRKGPWKFQTFLSRLDSDVDTIPSGVIGPLPLRDRIVSNTFDFEMQRELSLGSHNVLIGLNTRRLSTHSDVILGSREEETLYAAFAQDEYRVNEWITTFLGARFDDHPKTGLSFSPRAGLVFDLGESSRARMSFAQSFRNPTQVLNYSSLTLPGAVPVTLNGNEDLDPVWVTAYQIGFETMLHPRLRGRLDLFYNVIEDFQLLVPVGIPPPVILSWVNADRTVARGGELALEFQLLDSMSGFATYSFQSAHGRNEGATPRHKASAGVRGTLGARVRYALSAALVGHTTFEAGPVNPPPDPTIPSRFTVDAFIGVRVSPQFELGLQGRNLFHQTRRQHPLGDEIGSEVLLSGTWEF